MSFGQWFPVIVFGGAGLLPVLIFAGSAIHKRLLDASHGVNLTTLPEHQRYIHQKALAARWLFGERSNAYWITWAVLTKYNQAPNSLQLPELTAQRIFDELAYKQLISPKVIDGFHVVYTWNLSDETAWREAGKVPTVYRRLLSWARANIGNFVFWLFGLAIGIYIDHFVFK